MALQPVGTTEPIATLFNSGKLTINSDEIGEVTNISVTMNQNAVGYNTLNKRIFSKLKAGNYSYSGSFDIEGGLYAQIIKAFAGSSSPASGGTEYSSKDTQPDAVTVWITTYEDDDTDKPIQLQLVDPIFTDASPSLEQEAFGKQTIAFESRDIVVFVDDTVSGA